MSDTAPSTSHFLAAACELNAVLSSCGKLDAVVQETGGEMIRRLRLGGKVLTCGNGGSAADALHLAEELVGRYRRTRRPLAAICLNADVTALTCIANDFGYDQVFARQVEAIGSESDLFVGFTTSGNSPSVVNAILAALHKGMSTVLVSGGDGGAAGGSCRYEILVPSTVTARIQEVHTLILHSWLEMIELQSW